MKRSKFQRKLDGFLRHLFFEENGKPKSASLLYAFLLAILFLLIYGASYLILLDPLEAALSERAAWVRNAAEYLLPALAGSTLCLLFLLLPGKKKEVVTGAYAWMAVFLAAAMIFELFLIDWSDAKTDYGMFMAILGLPGIVSVLSGGVPAALMIRRERRKQKTQETMGVRPSRRDG